MMLGRTIAVFAVLPALVSCASIRDAERNMIKYQADSFLARGNAEPVDLIALISGGQETTVTLQRDGNFDQKLHRLVVAFSTPSTSAAPRRNLIQDRLKQAADQACQEYKTTMLSKQARANFWLGTTSLLFGAAGAATTTVDVARAFAGASALFTGVRSEYNQSFYLDKTVNVLTKAISRRQSEVWNTIEVKRAKSIASYSLYEAVRDVSDYHATCSLVGALELTDRAVDSFNVLKAVNDAVANEVALAKLRSSLGLTLAPSAAASAPQEDGNANPGTETAPSSPSTAASSPTAGASAPQAAASSPPTQPTSATK